MTHAQTAAGASRPMARFFLRAVAVSAGVVLGMAVVAGVSSWRDLQKKRDAEPPTPAPIQREPAPDTRV
jgi:hypothetical protein